jgi:Kef-type K+ transport system membrane component KefB
VPGGGRAVSLEVVGSLFWITLAAVVAPVVVGLLLRARVAEVVVLLVLGMVIGPEMLDIATPSDAVDVLRALGLGMLFLLAGYEIKVDELVGPGGRRAGAAWLLSIALALGLTFLLETLGLIDAEVAIAIALTSTSLGTLLPILKDSGMLGTRFGTTLLTHGAYGELGPILAMVVLLSTRGPFASALVVLVFAVVAVLVYVGSRWLSRRDSRLLDLVRVGTENSGQLPVRLVMLLLVGLGSVAAELEIDVVLGAFAAGMILRLLVPEGHEPLELRLEGLAFGFLIPFFFVTSGMAIDPDAVLREPEVLVAFVLLILLVRGLPVYRVTRAGHGDASSFTRREAVAMGLFASTGLPIIVAVTTVAVASGHLSAENASVLVAGGAVTVLVCPLTGQRLLREARVTPAAR